MEAMARKGLTTNDIRGEKDDDKKWEKFGRLFEEYAKLMTGAEDKEDHDAARSAGPKIVQNRVAAGAAKRSEGCTYARDVEEVAKILRRTEEVRRRKKRA